MARAVASSFFRATLALSLGFATSVHAQVSSEEREALIALFDSTGGSNWIDNTNWLGPVGSECTWFGVYCSGGLVRYLLLYDNNLVGSIPSQIAQLRGLANLDVERNSIGGSIPEALGSLDALEILAMGSNEIDGVLPSSLGSLLNLRQMSLYSNRLIGAIPSELGDLRNLQSLHLENNRLSGPIPDEIGNLFDLVRLDLDGNRLEGPIPASLANLTNLTHLVLNDNQLVGSIPAEFGGFPNLGVFMVDRNRLKGFVPTDLVNLSSLRDEIGLNLCGNSLSAPNQSVANFLDSKHSRWGNWEDCQSLYWDDFELGRFANWSAGRSVCTAVHDGSLETYIYVKDNIPSGVIVGKVSSSDQLAETVQIGIHWTGTEGAVDELSFILLLFDDSGEDGTPGVLLAATPAVVSDIPQSPATRVSRVSIPEGIVDGTGNLHVGVHYDGTTAQGAAVAVDTNGASIRTIHFSTDFGSSWLPVTPNSFFRTLSVEFCGDD
jgi:hypothetical protein